MFRHLGDGFLLIKVIITTAPRVCCVHGVYMLVGVCAIVVLGRWTYRCLRPVRWSRSSRRRRPLRFSVPVDGPIYFSHRRCHIPLFVCSDFGPVRIPSPVFQRATTIAYLPSPVPTVIQGSWVFFPVLFVHVYRSRTQNVVRFACNCSFCRFHLIWF